MLFPIVIHKDHDSDYGVTVPDLPGCFSAGETLAEAVANAREAIELHIEGLIDAGQAVQTGDLNEHHINADYAGGIWHLVNVDPADLRGNAQRVNITIPERVLERIDRMARASGTSRSGYLVAAALRGGEKIRETATIPEVVAGRKVAAMRASGRSVTGKSYSGARKKK